jgi:hypothetical protein
MPSSRRTIVHLYCSRDCGYLVDAETAVLWDIPCPNHGGPCVLKDRVRAYRRRKWLREWGWLFALLGIFILVVLGKSIADAVGHALYVVSVGLYSLGISLFWAGLFYGLFWISNHFGLPGRLLLAIKSLLLATKSLWDWLCALESEIVSNLTDSLSNLTRSGPWWLPRAADSSRPEVAGTAFFPEGPGGTFSPEGASPERLAEGEPFQSGPKFICPNSRCMGNADTSIAAAISYIQFGDWDMSLIDRALADPRASEALNDLLLYAMFGSVQIWGRTSFDFDWQPFEQGYWREHVIDRFSVLKREKPFTKRVGEGNRQREAEAYTDLRTSRAQLEAICSV